MPTRVRRAVAPHKVMRQVERAAMKDLNAYLLKAKKLIHDIVDKSQPDSTQMTLAGSQALKKGIQHPSSNAVGVQTNQPSTQEVSQTKEAIDKRWDQVSQWENETNGVR